MQENRKDLTWIPIISIIIAAGLVTYFLLLAVILPVSRFRVEVPQTQKKKAADEKLIIPDPAWLGSVNDSVKSVAYGLLSEESYLLSKLAMTESDSISMAISLKDSSISLVVQGVTIYNARIQSFHSSRIFSRTDPVIVAQYLSVPFIMEEFSASIPKVPMLYKKAPKDTIEAMSQLEPDPLNDDLSPVYYTIKLNRKLILRVEQYETPEKENIEQLKGYRRQINTARRKDIFNALLRCKPLEFIPEIKIGLDKKSARVIYRALPVDALISIQLSDKQ